MSSIGDVINGAVERFYQDGPQNSPGPAGHIIAALGWAGFWISEDVTPVSNRAVLTLQTLSSEIELVDLREWAGADMLRHKRADEIDRLRRVAGQICTKHPSPDGQSK